MLPITVYNQSGGQSKSTITRDLAAAYAELGLDVLVVDFDAQNGSVSNYLGVDEDKHNPDADDLTLHLIDQGKGSFRDLIRTVEGEDIDVIPSHKRFNRVDQRLDQHADYLEASKPEDWSYPRYERFFQVLQENDIQNEYDVMLVDPNAKADEGYYLALYATRNILIPAEPTRGGQESIAGVKDSARNFAEEMDINITLSGVVPTKVDTSKNIHKEYLQKIRQQYPSPVYFKNLGAFEKAEENYESVFTQLKGTRVRDYNADIMPKFRTLAAFIYHRAGKELPGGGWPEDELFPGNDLWGEVDLDRLTTDRRDPAEVER
jgi:cellulose biosynthesis protein BcsQ